MSANHLEVLPAAAGVPRGGVLALVGDTPLVPLLKLGAKPGVEIYAKVERSNPGGSIKDRIALWMIEAAEHSGELTPGKTILEATSGNTGIGLATVAAAKGYKVLLAMSEGASLERRKTLAALGAEFLLTPADLGTDGAIERAYELAAREPERYCLTDQYNNPANVLAHYHSTAPELWAQTGGRLTHLVATMGTTGTLMGCSRRLRELSPRVRIIGVEPYLGHKIQGLKNLKEAYVPGIYSADALDEKLNVEDDAAYEMARRLARDEGLLVGMSSGAAVHVAVQVAQQIESGVVVAICPDSGERYLSTTLFQIAVPEAVPARLHFFNTLTGRHEPFEPARGPGATMYSCGPTVHRRPHLGLLRRMLVDDLVRRTLELDGFEVEHVVSITDLDDNTIRVAEQSGEKMSDLCARHEAEFHADLAALGAKPATRYVRASESVADMIGHARALVEAGVAYEKLHSVYFNIGRVKSYGELSGKDLGKIRIGATVDLERYDKDDPRDFTLLRRATLGEIRKGVSTKTEWGNVRPSWHVQCSAMARAALGDRFDIHTASADLVFPHNENELAQSRALTGEPQARYWLHSELVLVGGKKMAYDEPSCVTLPDLVQRGYSPREVRFFLLRTHYRQPVQLADDRLEDARASLKRIDDCVANLRAVTAGPDIGEAEGWCVELREAFRAALFDDLNVAGALAAVFRLVRQVNHVLGKTGMSPRHAAAVIDALHETEAVLAVLPSAPEASETLPEVVAELARAREEARSAGDFIRADDLRAQLVAQGFVVEDRPEGTRVRRM